MKTLNVRYGSWLDGIGSTSMSGVTTSHGGRGGNLESIDTSDLCITSVTVWEDWAVMGLQFHGNNISTGKSWESNKLG